MPDPQPVVMHQLAKGFDKIPSFAEWIKLSDLGLSFPKPPRRNDPALVQMDTLMAALSRATEEAKRNYLLCELWFAASYWRNNVMRNPRQEKARLPTITSLLLCVQNTLGKNLGCGVGGLATRLSQTYGTSMSTHGIFTDAGENAAEAYLKAADLDTWRLVFDAGKAKRFDFRNGGKLVPCSTEYFYDAMSANDKIGLSASSHQGWAYFVMSMSREIFMGPHMSKEMTNRVMPKFHSSYKHGGPIQCGGSMCIEDGVVLGIMNDSGHYQPKDATLVHVLQRLKTGGVDIRKIEVFTKVAGTQVNGELFLQENGNWDGLRRTLLQPMYNEFKAMKKSLHQVVTEYFDRQLELIRKNNAHAGLKEPINEVRLWESAYKAVCWDLALFDPSWKARVDSPAIPRTKPALSAVKVG